MVNPNNSEVWELGLESIKTKGFCPDRSTTMNDKPLHLIFCGGLVFIGKHDSKIIEFNFKLS